MRLSSSLAGRGVKLGREVAKMMIVDFSIKRGVNQWCALLIEK